MVTLDTRRIMWLVLAALLPGAAATACAWSIGVGAQMAVGMVTAMAADHAMIRLRGLRDGSHALDGSAAVTGAIIGLALPPLAPFWVAAAAALFAVCIAKHCYGGLGANIFNPAMAGYVFAFLAFPREFAVWPDAGAGLPALESLRAVLVGETVDVSLAPTVIQTGDSLSWRETVPAAFYALGGAALVASRIADWRLAFPYILGVALTAWIADDVASVTVHLAAGGTVMAAFFVLTDPVSAPKRSGNRIVLALAAGALTVAVRKWGSHPDGIAFAVLIFNMLAPAADRLAEELEGMRRRG